MYVFDVLFNTEDSKSTSRALWKNWWDETCFGKAALVDDKIIFHE